MNVLGYSTNPYVALPKLSAATIEIAVPLEAASVKQFICLSDEGIPARLWRGTYDYRKRTWLVGTDNRSLAWEH